MTIQHVESFANYLTNIQTGIINSAYRELDIKWIHPQAKKDYNILYYMVSGRCRIQLNNEEFCPTSGQLIILPAGASISASSYHGEPFAKYYCHFTASIGETYLFDLLRLSTVINVEEDKPEIESQFNKLVYYYKSKDMTSALRAKTILNQLICYLVEQSPIRSLNYSTHPAFGAINVVMDYMEKHLSEKLSIEELAKIAHFHPHYFIELFKSLTGYSPIQYVSKLRFERAQVLLTSTILSINEIAEHVGIQLDYFYYFFKNHSGMSPTEYRKKQKIVY